jgi:dolichol-phosphate mannosyltransferase
MKQSTTPLLSVIVPMYNEAEGAELFHNSLVPHVKTATKDSFEIIYVNDGSKDATFKILSQLARKKPSIKVVNLSRNFGKEIATTAGISIASGDATIIMDGDGQHPPELIAEFIKKWQAGAQVVIGIRDSNQKEGIIKKWGSKVFYKLFNAVSDAETIPRSTDFRLFDSVVRKEFLSFTERNRMTRGLIDWLGFKRDYIIFDAPARIAGEASYKTSQLVKLAMNSFVSLSLKPLFFFGWVGVAITTLSLLLGLFIIVEQALLGDPLSLGFTGSAMLGIFMSFLIGLVLISQAVLAIYLSHVHTQTQERPLFVIDSSTSINL